jgi:hypothetical protein
VGARRSESSVYGLIVGYEITREPSLLAEIKTRIAPLAMDRVDATFDGSATQAQIFAAIDKADWNG